MCHPPKTFKPLEKEIEIPTTYPTYHTTNWSWIKYKTMMRFYHLGVFVVTQVFIGMKTFTVNKKIFIKVFKGYFK